MTDRPHPTDDDRSQDTPTDGFRRREFVALGAGASATMLAGCAGDGGLTPSGDSDGTDGSDDSETLTGDFRLLISDAPADIGDFGRLDVTLDEARAFTAGDEETDDEDDEAAGDEDDEAADDEDDEAADDEDGGSNPAGNETGEDDPVNGTADDGGDAEDPDDEEEEDGEEDDGDDDGEEDADGEEGDDSDRGFTVVDLEDATVDLTQVIEDDAMAVFDGEIPAGSYEKVELSVTTVEGIVDGEEVDVKLPSEKLQITNGFEVTPDEPVSFVFDINVVKRGKNNGYILKPVISGSGVAGRDVEVNEIDEDDEDDGGNKDEGDDSDGGEEQDADDEDADDEDADDEDADDGSTAGGNETDDGSSDAENGTATNATES